MASTRVAAALVAVAAVAVAAGCGGSSKSAPPTTAPSTTTTLSTGAQKSQISDNWSTFFSGSATASQKIPLLQNGQRFAPLIQAEAKSPLAKQTKATVSNVQLHGNTATVTYTISLAGKPVLTNRKGTAVRVGGTWQVGDQSFCQLLGLQGTVPAACKAASSS